MLVKFNQIIRLESVLDFSGKKDEKLIFVLV